MKKEPNSRPRKDRHNESLPRTSILRGKHNFQRLFERSTILRTPHMLFRYRIYDDPDEGFLISFIAGKRVGNAVLRNRIKRHMRESYRRQQHLIDERVRNRTYGLHGAFLAQSANLTAGQTDIEMASLLGQLLSRLEESPRKQKRHTSSNS